MKRFIQIISTSSSTTKLLILIVVLTVIVLFASSSFYIQYRNNQALKVAEAAMPSETKKATKVPLSELATKKSSPDTSEISLSNKANATSGIPQARSQITRAGCREQILLYSTIRKGASWLYKGETRVEEGRNGLSKVCNSRVVMAQEPVTEIIYEGTKVLPTLVSPINSMHKDTGNILNNSLQLSR